MSPTLGVHAKTKTGRVLNLLLFVSKKNGVIYALKRRNFDGVFMPSLLLGYQSRMGGDSGHAIKTCNWVIKNPPDIKTHCLNYLN